MRITAILLLAVSLHVSARTVGQRITIKETNAPLRKVFRDIHRQTGMEFFYEEEQVSQVGPITIDVQNAPLEAVLAKCFKDVPFQFTIKGSAVYLQRVQAQPVPTIAQVPTDSTQIKGRIVTAKGERLAGATVALKGTDKIAVTDSKGEFLLKGIKNGSYTVMVSYVGYDRLQSVVQAGVSDLILTLKEATNTLDEAQVIAYGSVSTREQVGNVTTVKAETIERQNVTNPLMALQGQVAGLLVTQSTGLPGTGVTVRVQGQNSIQNGNDPLYVIDGVPYNSQLLPSINYMLGGSGASGPGGVPIEGNPMSFLNPGDIETIEVLKDADATSIYGSRAANGAILITTKKGKVGQTRVNINFQDGFGKVPKFVNMMNTQQYLEMRHEAKANDGATIAASDYDMNGFWDTTRNTNWQKTLLGGTAQYMNTSATISGGAPNIQYLVGGTYHRETTVFPGDFNDQKASMHVNLNMNSNNRKFKAQFSTNYQYDMNRLPGTDLTQSAVTLAPDAPSLYDKSGKINWAANPAGSSTWTNPLAYTLEKYNNGTTALFSNLTVSYEIMTGLDLRINTGYNSNRSDQQVLNPILSIAPQRRATHPAYATIGNDKSSSWIVEPQITYKTGALGGKFDFLVGSTIQSNNSNFYHINADGYSNDQQLGDISAAGSLTKLYSYSGNYKYNAVFARVNYSYQDKYIIDLSGRRDGSSRFGPENRFHDFMSVGGAWIFSNEMFFKNDLKFLVFGKLRGSYGTTGNDQIGDYAYLSQYVANANVQYGGVTTLYPTGLSNPYLEWESTRKLQFGIDLGLFKNGALLFTANYVKNKSSNQLLSYTLPNFVGYGSVTENFPATVQNSEWEFSLKSKNISSKNFEWSTNLNLTIPKNRLVAFPGIENSTYASYLIVGQPITINKVFHSEGVDPQSGVYKFQSKTDPFNPDFTTDASVVINTAPKWYGGIENVVRWKGFSFSFLFQYVNHKAPNYASGLYSVPGIKSVNQPTFVLNRWQKAGDNAPIQRYNSNSAYYTPYLDQLGSDAGYSDASFLKLRNASINWEMPQPVIAKMHIQGLKIFAQGQNLVTFSTYKVSDPETASPLSLPPLRVITIGAQLSL